MSKIALKGNASGTGTFQIEAPNSNTDRTLVLPDEAGTVLTSASDLLAANLTGDVASARITGALNATGSAPIYACRAWVNWNGQGTVAIRASGNVSSITDVTTGLYDINMTTAMPDANYACSATSGQTFGHIAVAPTTASLTPTASVFRVANTNSSGTLTDPQTIAVAVFR